MTIRSEREKSRLTLTIEGILNVKTTPELVKELTREALDGIDEIIIDMKDLEYTSSVGLRALLSAYQIIDERDGRMVFQHLRPEIKEIFELSGFADYIEFQD